MFLCAALQEIVISDFQKGETEMGVHDVDMYPAARRLLELPEDEPFFIFRAQDRNSPSVLLMYETSCMGSGCSDGFIAAIRISREEFLSWQAKYPGRVKVPD